jgi:hypothetical protein
MPFYTRFFAFFVLVNAIIIEVRIILNSFIEGGLV